MRLLSNQPMLFMNENELPPSPEAPERRVRLNGPSCNFKVPLAFILGVLSFLLMFVVGSALEGALGKYGEYALAIGIGACFLISQYFLSRGNPQALRKVWPSIIAMNCTPLCAAILCLVFETKGAGLAMLLVTMLTVACSYAGAAMAARTARR